MFYLRSKIFSNFIFTLTSIIETLKEKKQRGASGHEFMSNFASDWTTPSTTSTTKGSRKANISWSGWRVASSRCWLRPVATPSLTSSGTGVAPCEAGSVVSTSFGDFDTWEWENFSVKLFTQSKALTTFLLAFPTDSVDQRLPRDQPPTNIFGIGTSARGKRAANVWTLFAGGDSVSELLCCLRGMCIADFRVAHGACWSICSWTCLQCQYRYPDQRLMSLIKKIFFLRDIWGYKICCCKN